MNRNQIIVLIGSVLLFLVLYFGFSKVPTSQLNLEKSRAMNMEATSVANLISQANDSLTEVQKSIIAAINLDLNESKRDTLVYLERLKSLAGTWYEYKFPSISATYAEEIANISKSEESWSIAGTTYALCVKSTIDQKEKEFCSKRAIKAFENALSIAPDNIDTRINLAICYVDNPLQDNPMQGILMLRDLNTKYPENIAVLNQLARLALQTNQIDKAISRLETAIGLEPENQMTICLLASAYRSAGDVQKANEFENKCVN